jgi:PAS domain S-box-containing protein
LSISTLAPFARLLRGRRETAAGRVAGPAPKLNRGLAAHLIIPLAIGAGLLVVSIAFAADVVVRERIEDDLVARRSAQATETARRFVLDAERGLLASARQLSGLPGVGSDLADDSSRLQTDLLAAQNRDHLGFILVLGATGEVKAGLMVPPNPGLLQDLLPRAQTRNEASSLAWAQDSLWLVAAATQRTPDAGRSGLVVVGQQLDDRTLPDLRTTGVPIALGFAGRTVGSSELPDSRQVRTPVVTAGGDVVEAIANVPLRPYRDAMRLAYTAIAATAIGCLLLFIGYSSIVVRRAARPLTSLAQAAVAVAGGARHVDAPVEGPAEVATASRAFNEMVAAIAAREEELRRLASENGARYRELEVLNELSLTILASPDLETIGNHLLAVCMAFGSFDLGIIFLRDPVEDILSPFVSRGYHHPEWLVARGRDVIDPGRDRPRRRYSSLFTQVSRVIEDLQAEDGFRAMKAEDVRSVIFVPLRAEDEVLGLLQLMNRSPRHFEPSEIRFIESVGRQLGIAIQKARLHDQTIKAYAEQQAGEEARARLVAILEATTDVVGIVRADGKRMYLNRAGRRILGLTDDADISEVAVHEGRPAWAKERLMSEAIPGAIRDGSWTGETAYVAADGRELPFSQVIIAHQDADGKVAFLSTIARDISAQKEAEQQREVFAQTEKLRALGQMAGGIAHDLNQCLALVAGHTELAIRSLKQDRVGDEEPLRSSLATVLRAARDGAQSVKRLQTYARPAQSEVPVKLNLGTLLDEVATLTAPAWRDAAQQEGRHIDVRVTSDADATIEGSPPDLREAFTNLVFNAVDALPGGGTIALRALRQDGCVVAEVQDSGVGMPADVRARIFEPFFTTKGAQGLGLGLSMVFGVVERHSGRVEVDSAPGQGTTFRLSFPAASGAADSAETIEGLASARSLRILAVDDEPDIANMVSLMLQPYGHRMAVATSGEEALERLAVEPFDLVISDVGMGARMNGWELAERVRSEFPAVRLVLATGWGAEIDQDEARARGVDAVVSKPFRIADLQRVVAAL